MKRLMKQMIVFLAVVTSCLSCSAGALAERIFGEDFAAACNLPPEETFFGGACIATIQDTVFQRMQSGDIYTWDSQTNEYAYYAHVPESPTFNVEVAFSLQSDTIKIKITDAVTHLIPAAEGIYGFNYYNGAIGLIDTAGIHLSDVKLDVSCMLPKGSDYPWEFQNAFVEDGMLYAYFNMGMISSQKAEPSLLIFDLSTGACSPIALPDTISFCRHTPGKLLFLQDNGTETPALALFDIASRQLTALDVAVPISISRKSFAKSWDLRSKIGGLAYDVVRDIIYLADTQGLWHSIAGAPFERKMVESAWESLNPLGDAWVLASGGYVSRIGWQGPDYVKP